VRFLGAAQARFELGEAGLAAGQLAGDERRGVLGALFAGLGVLFDEDVREAVW